MLEKSKLLHGARVAAVQFAYLSAFTGKAANPKSLREFMGSHFFKEAREGLDIGFFSFLARGISRNMPAIDSAIVAQLSKGGTDTMTMSILRAGAFEILFRANEAPQAAVASAYTGIAAEFAGGTRTGVVNAVLSKLKTTLSSP